MNKYEVAVSQLIDNKYAVVDELFDPEHLKRLREDLLDRFEEGQLKTAGIGKKFDYEKNIKVRGDKILWLDKKVNKLHEQYLKAVENFMEYINRTCYTSLNSYEFHYAVYKPGAFYKRHLDQFRSDRGRQFSMVTYLNPNWKNENGGELVLYLEGEREEVLLPEFGKSIIFKSSEIEHEVKETKLNRLSIAGWLKCV